MNWGTAHEKDAVLCAFVQVCRVLCLALCHGGVRGMESEFVCVGGGKSPPERLFRQVGLPSCLQYAATPSFEDAVAGLEDEGECWDLSG